VEPAHAHVPSPCRIENAPGGRYARDSIPPTPPGHPTDVSIGDFTPGELLGCVSGELGLRKFLEDRGHTLVVTSDKDGPGCELERELVDADVVISQPFWPAYITAERMAMAPKLKARGPLARFCPPPVDFPPPPKIARMRARAHTRA